MLRQGTLQARAGQRSASTRTAAPVHGLMEAGDENRLPNLQRQPARLNPMIIDEPGFVPPSRT